MFSAVLDACALYPQSLRDVLLRLAGAELYAPLWSDRILDEMERNVIERGIDPNKVARTVRLMREAFEEAEVDADKISALEPAMTNDEKDRHVLAAAVASGSDLVVTFNLRDFPDEACAPVGVSAISPDEFLVDLFDLSPGVVHGVLAELVTGLRETNLDEFLGDARTCWRTPLRRRDPRLPPACVRTRHAATVLRLRDQGPVLLGAVDRGRLRLRVRDPR